MTLTEFITTHDLDFSIKFSTYTEKWYCSSMSTEIKDGSILIGSIGEHCKTPNEAIESTVKTIKGKTLVINAYTEKRKEIKVPKTMTP